MEVKLKEIGADEHGIAQSSIPPYVFEIVKTLNEAGYDAYIVGGAIRDLLIDREPKDFDITTNAEPKEIKQCFKRSVLIGKRFTLVHVFTTGKPTVEVSTYRGKP